MGTLPGTAEKYINRKTTWLLVRGANYKKKGGNSADESLRLSAGPGVLPPGNFFLISIKIGAFYTHRRGSINTLFADIIGYFEGRMH